MDKLTEIREWNEEQKSKIRDMEAAGLNVSVDTSIYGSIDYLLQLVEEKDQKLEEISKLVPQVRSLNDESNQNFNTLMKTCESLVKQIEEKDKALDAIITATNTPSMNINWGPERMRLFINEKAHEALRGESKH
ncbi:hypothetical protein KXR68_12840, partial [Staphylococcus warneri]|uniref:hypothetical protein n=1 Tax=Staphylococcus warneri TaxID=1292 RepID=UPI003F16AA2F